MFGPSADDANTPPDALLMKDSEETSLSDVVNKIVSGRFAAALVHDGFQQTGETGALPVEHIANLKRGSNLTCDADPVERFLFLHDLFKLVLLAAGLIPSDVVFR